MAKKDIIQVEKKIRVVVAMSGGVDSSVAAALLKKQKYDVVGVFMRFWHESQNDAKGVNTKERRNTCCSEGAEAAARAVAAKLGISFYVLRLEKEFKKEVVDYFLAEEKKGRTPNPCVVCNKKIKFGLLFEKALALGADFIATGHYARLQREITNSKSQTKLFKAKDENKDQSYFLYTLNQKQLSRVLFPVGDYTKDEVYKMAKKWKLPYRQDESFDLCFVERDRESFIRRYLKIKTGDIRDIGENILGQHQGLTFYTIGQRKNISLNRGPWWVIKKDERKNILYVSNNEKDLYGDELFAYHLSWLGGETPKMPTEVLAKIRYKSELAKSTIRPALRRRLRQGEQAQGKNYIKVIFEKTQRAITPGQSVVFYNNKGELLGGGVIHN